MAGLPGHEGTRAGTSCPVCYGEYWTRLRVRLHLKASQQCQATIAYGGVPELSDEEVRRLDAKDLAQRRDNVAAGRHLHHAARPALPGFLATRSCGGVFRFRGSRVHDGAPRHASE